MEFVRGDYNLCSRHRKCVVALGGFDGLHLGHRAVIDCAVGLAKSRAQPVAVVLFEPLPREFFEATDAPPRLYPLRERVAIIAAMGVERIFCLRFNAQLAAMKAEEFVERIMVGKLDIQTLVVGEGFHFGRGRIGGTALLQALAGRFGFEFECVDTVMTDANERISSTRVREMLSCGDFASAARLLGRPYSVSGRVGHGSKRGTQIGFPTANLVLGRRLPPVRGIFAVVVKGIGKDYLPGVVNAGYRPTFGNNEFCFEVHLPGFSGSLYGCRLSVEFLAKIRDEQKFDTLDTLKSRIKEDIKVAMELIPRA